MSSPDVSTRKPGRASRREPAASDYVAGGAPLTGAKVLAMLVAFFGLVVFLNLGILLPNAIGTFRGLETDSAYRESQRFNVTLAEAAAQVERGWRVEASLFREADGSARIEVAARDRDGAALAGLSGEAVLARPSDRYLDRGGALLEIAPGVYEARVAAPPAGQWDLVLSLARDGDPLFRSRNRLSLR